MLLKHLYPQTSTLQLETLNSTNASDTKSLSVIVVACVIQYEIALMEESLVNTDGFPFQKENGGWSLYLKALNPCLKPNDG